MKYYLPIDCDKVISIILTKLICERQKRLTLKELLLDEIIKNKIIKKIKQKFYDHPLIGQNLFTFSKILFFSYIKMDKNDNKIKIYKELIKSINRYFNEEKIKEFDLNNFALLYEYKDKIKSIYKRTYDFIPKIKLIFNDVQIIDKEILDSLNTKIKELFNENDIKIIEIKKGSLSVTLALNYLIKEKLKNVNEDNKDINIFLDNLNEYLKVETNNIKNILKEKLFIAQKDKVFRPNFAEENLFDLGSDTSKDELRNYIRENNCKKDNNNKKNILKDKLFSAKKDKEFKHNFSEENLFYSANDTSKDKLNNDIEENIYKNENNINIYEISKEITFEEMKNFFDSLSDETKEIQDLLYEKFSEVNNELENNLQIFDDQFEEALKRSIFEYQAKYIAYIYQNDEKFISGQLHCNNIEKK